MKLSKQKRVVAGLPLDPLWCCKEGRFHTDFGGISFWLLNFLCTFLSPYFQFYTGTHTRKIYRTAMTLGTLMATQTPYFITIQAQTISTGHSYLHRPSTFFERDAQRVRPNKSFDRQPSLIIGSSHSLPPPYQRTQRPGHILIRLT